MEKIYHGTAHFNTIFSQFGFPESEWERIREDRDSRYCALLRTKAEWMDGALNALESAQSDCQIGMMTGSWRRYVDALDERSKPHPYGLELLAKRMNVDPKKCLYIGDQLFDVQAANAAGMTSCLLQQEWTPEGAAESANIVCSSIRDYCTLKSHK
jgi:HAD superfamily hydrolase (TIGR01509 family)